MFRDRIIPCRNGSGDVAWCSGFSVVAVSGLLDPAVPDIGMGQVYPVARPLLGMDDDRDGDADRRGEQRRAEARAAQHDDGDAVEPERHGADCGNQPAASATVVA
jgi:hypothetical protein